MIADNLSYLGRGITDNIEGFGRFTRFCMQALRWTVAGIASPANWRLLLPQLYYVGTKSIPVVMIVGAFIGMVLAVEAYDQFAMIGLEDRLGGIINVSVVKQIGPVMAAIMIAGRVGGAVSAELGTMRVTEQIDALRVMGADPIRYLVVPRVLACIIMVPILTLYSDIMGIAGGELVTVYGFGVNLEAYRHFAAVFSEPYDMMTGLLKSVFFGIAIGLISCYKGFNCRAGAAGVGRAATDSFVTSFLAIIIMNLVLAKFLKDLSFMIWGETVINLSG